MPTLSAATNIVSAISASGGIVCATKVIMPGYSQNGHAFDLRRLQSAGVSNVTNNGSNLFRITTSGAHSRSTGDRVTLASIGGTPNANGNWTITVINSTTFDLQGSTFAGTYTSGGTVSYLFTVDFVNGDLDLASLITIANGQSLWIDQWYDQSGNNNHLVQHTITNQFQLSVRRTQLLTAASGFEMCYDLFAEVVTQAWGQTDYQQVTFMTCANGSFAGDNQNVIQVTRFHDSTPPGQQIGPCGIGWQLGTAALTCAYSYSRNVNTTTNTAALTPRSMFVLTLNNAVNVGSVLTGSDQLSNCRPEVVSVRCSGTSRTRKLRGVTQTLATTSVTPTAGTGFKIGQSQGTAFVSSAACTAFVITGNALSTTDENTTISDLGTIFGCQNAPTTQLIVEGTSSPAGQIYQVTSPSRPFAYPWRLQQNLGTVIMHNISQSGGWMGDTRTGGSVATNGTSTITGTSTAFVAGDVNRRLIMTDASSNLITSASKSISGAANNGSGFIRITSTAHGLQAGNQVTIASVGGTTEANGADQTVSAVSDADHFDLPTAFVHTYTSGGTWTTNTFNITARSSNTSITVSPAPSGSASGLGYALTLPYQGFRFQNVHQSIKSPDNVDRMYNATLYTRGQWIFLDMGSNDVYSLSYSPNSAATDAANIWASYKVWAAARRGVGYKVACSTVLPAGVYSVHSEAIRQAYNTLVRSDYVGNFDALWDIEGFGWQPGGSSDWSYFFADQTHLTEAGQARMASLLLPIVRQSLGITTGRRIPNTARVGSRNVT